MPRGVPNINREPTAPGAEVLGIVNPVLTDPTPPTASWGSIDMTEPPPPWETEDQGLALSDARRFVTVPTNWELRWINPKVLNAEGWRYWQPVMASDERVKVKVPTMVSPEGNIRRGHEGDILAWMYKSWVEARRRAHALETARLTQSAVERQEELKEEFKRGKYGPNIRLEEARHPTHTIGDGRSMTD